MALPTNTFTTVAAVGNREDLEDVIYNVAPSETPLMSSIDRTKATATNHEWQTDTIDSANTSNAKIQGDDASTSSTTATVRLGNYSQIMDKVPRVSGTQQAVDHAGRGDEIDYQLVLKGKALKVDMESIAFGTNQAKLVAAAATAPLMASALSWVKTNTQKGATGSDPSAADGTGTRGDGTQRAFTEALLKANLQQIWTSGGAPDRIFLGGFNKQQMSTFTGRATPQEDSTKKKIVNSVDVYEGDFGTQKVTASRNIRSRDCLVMQWDKWSAAFLRNMETMDLARVGDSIRKQLLVEWTLVSRNEKASGGVFDLTTS